MHIEFEPGKLLNELKTRLPDVTDLVFRRKATEAGMLPSELLRDLVCEYVHGAPYLDLLLQHRRDARVQGFEGVGLDGAWFGHAVKADELHRPYQGGKA